MTLTMADIGKEYIVKDFLFDDEELRGFLFSLGCYSNEPITVISHVNKGFIVAIKDAKYNIDFDLANAIVLDEESSV